MIPFKPLRGLVLIDREMPPEQQGGIIIPETSRWYGWRASVCSIGAEVTCVKPGDQILFLKEFTRLPFKKERNMAITNAENIAATIIIEGDTERINPVNDYVLVKPEAVPSDTGVAIVRRWDQPSNSGLIVKAGGDCEIADTFIGKKCWFPTNKAIKCVEDDLPHILIQEGDLLCIEAP